MGKYLDLAMQNAQNEFERMENEVLQYKDLFLTKLAEHFAKSGELRFDSGHLITCRTKDNKYVDFRADLRILRKWAEEEGFKTTASCWYAWHDGEPDMLTISLPRR